ncbi:sialoadhesin-like, partial [Anguilla rostrata]|uniref:sialoadhesin-like n=1 Tax=Anguilla rostrata TaxID=7938 RepID=UPI0030CAB0B5
MLFKILLVIVLSVSGVLCQWKWGVTYTPERICALKGSSVDMSCTYSYPPYYTVQKTFWFIYDWNSKQEGEPEDLSQDPEYSDRVEYLGDQNSDCTFRIKQLKESDSAIYRFRFLTDRQDGKYVGLSGVSLTVTGLQVKVTENEAQSVTLTCSSTCTLSGSPTFTWNKNGKVVSNKNKKSINLASTDDTDLYSCATGGVTSPAVNVKCVKVEMESETRSEGEWVTLTCKITCTDLTGSQTLIWYKNGQFLQNTTQKYQKNHHYLQFLASSGDAGSYSCAVRGHENLLSPAVTLYAPKNTSVSVPPPGEIVEGKSVTLTCSSDANPPVQNYTWYKNNRAVSSETGGPVDSYTIKNITLQDAVEYICEAENAMGTNRTPPKLLDVQCEYISASQLQTHRAESQYLLSVFGQLHSSKTLSKAVTLASG